MAAAYLLQAAVYCSAMLSQSFALVFPLAMCFDELFMCVFKTFEFNISFLLKLIKSND